MKKFKYIQIPENVLFLRCKKTNNFFMSTVNKIFKTNVFPILLTKRYIAKIIAGLIFHNVVEKNPCGLNYIFSRHTANVLEIIVKEPWLFAR